MADLVDLDVSPFENLKHKAGGSTEQPKKKQEPVGATVLESTWNTTDNSSTTSKPDRNVSSLPFGQLIEFSSISGTTYVTAQTLIQHVAYSMSDKIFSYSPESFNLDIAVQEWSALRIENINGYTTQVATMQTRSGAGSIALGYMFSKDFDLTKRHIPQSLLASVSSLHNLRSSLDQLSLLYSVANPLVAHIAAVDYAPASTGLATDYATALAMAEELGLGLVSSLSAYEAQHMALFSTILAAVLPTIHIYDGIKVGRDTLLVKNILSQAALKSGYSNVMKTLSQLSKRTDAETKVTHILNALNRELDTSYGLFEYHGHIAAENVLVVFGSVEASLAKQIVAKLSAKGSKVGVLNVRVYRPFVEEAFIEALPTSVQSITVLGQVLDQDAVEDLSVHSNLYEDVLAATIFSGTWATSLSVIDHKYSRSETFTPFSISVIFHGLSGKSTVDTRIDLTSAVKTEQFIFWDLDESSSVSAPLVVSKLLSNDATANITLSQTHDNFIQGGTTRTDIRSSSESIEAHYPVEDADVVVVGDVKLLKEIGILKNIKTAGKLIVKLPANKDEDLEKKFPVAVRNDIKFRAIKLFILDPTLSSAVGNDSTTETILLEVAFLKVAKPDLLGSGQSLAAINGNAEVLTSVLTDLDKALRQIEIPECWGEIEVDAEVIDLPRNIKSTSFTGFQKDDPEAPSLLRNWQSVAKGLIFKEAYGTQSALRPDLPVTTYEVTVQENRRLTPSTYDRNIFHIEFDVGQSGLKYNIGESLGIHAENNIDEVNEFIKFYGLNSDDVVELPSRENPNILETRTVFQCLVQNIDIFGKPPKRFYETLAEYASDEAEKKELLTLGGPEGANEFKRRAEVDTITYADVLLEFKSAHPSFHDVARIVSPMKRREYSIASSQMVNPTTVALMIVVVAWVDPKGRDRFGQATRYLSLLPIGTKVTVSVKPSVMKLPAKDTAPLIMAGLGTGLAPFRAFVQYRAMQKAQGKKIGSILLYMGSRHQREEYLYGEEWEAYQDAGVITLLGRAFSRDQPQKIYIQDRMRQTISDIIKAYIKEEGAFYLCGPTWPVPDVTEVLEEAIARDAKASNKKVDPRKEIERLKEDLRYVLEVY